MAKNSVANTVESKQKKSSNGKKSGISLAEIKKMSTLNIIDKIDAIIQNIENSGSEIIWNSCDTLDSSTNKLVIKGELKKYIWALARRFHLTLEQALFLSFFVKKCGEDFISFYDISSYFNNIDPYRIFEHADTLNSLTELGYIKSGKDYDGNVGFSMPDSAVQCIVLGMQPELPKINTNGKTSVTKYSNLELTEKVVEITKNNGLPEIDKNNLLKQYLMELGNRFNLTNDQALFLSIFISMCDDNRIMYSDFARFFGVKTPYIMSYVDTFNSLAELGYILKNNNNDQVVFRIPETVLMEFMQGIKPVWSAPCLTHLDWMTRLNRIIERVRTEELNDDELESLLQDNFSKYSHFDIVQKLKSFKLSIKDLKFYLILIVQAIMNDDFEISKYTLRSYYKDWEYLGVVKDFNPKDCKLFELELIDYVNEEGRCHHDQWCLTDKSKTEVLHEFLNDNVLSRDKQLLLYENIQEKQLYYCEDVTRQVEQLRQLLNIDNMNAVLDRMAKKGMRKGFACLFYGAPGTGKTETVLQLARQTGRDIMQVDISGIRDKWVGETEKNIKQIFDKYRNLVKNSNVTPILFFNEADALFNTRNEDSKHSVDKMENAMQNIILQELENLEGILIATTNLTQCLDPAFERRFLFKIEFIKPTPKERVHIWQAMMPELSDDTALKLAESFDFSGGQIENITRKAIIESILWNKDKLNLDNLLELCSHEQINERINDKIDSFYMIA